MLSFGINMKVKFFMWIVLCFTRLPWTMQPAQAPMMGETEVRDEAGVNECKGINDIREWEGSRKILKS